MNNCTNNILISFLFVLSIEIMKTEPKILVIKRIKNLKCQDMYLFVFSLCKNSISFQDKRHIISIMVKLWFLPKTQIIFKMMTNFAYVNWLMLYVYS